MDEYSNPNHNPDEPDTHGQTPQSDSSYDSRQPQTPESEWQNNQQPNNQQYWQNQQPNNQQYWQNQQPNNQQYWQNQQPNNQQYWQNQQPYGQPPQKRNGMALASMIFGILALVACCIPFIQFPLAVTAIVLVILSKKKQPFSGFAIAGLVLGIISVVISILMTLYWGYVLSLMNDPQFMELYDEMLKMYQ